MELEGPKDLHFWEIIIHWYENVHFRADPCKNTDYIKKCFKQKLHQIKFPTKNLVDTYVYLPWEWR